MESFSKSVPKSFRITTKIQRFIHVTRIYISSLITGEGYSEKDLHVAVKTIAHELFPFSLPQIRPSSGGPDREKGNNY